MNNIKILTAVLLLSIVFSCNKNRDYGYKDGTSPIGLAGPSITVDTSVKKIDSSKYFQARIFPGLVCSTEPRIDAELNMNLNYNPVTSDLKIAVPPQPLFSTGFYAAPGELVIITVPDGIFSLTVQIGAWSDNLSSVTTPPRDAVIIARSSLAPGKNYIRNLYGGHVYIRPEVPVAAPVQLKFSNVVKSPDFELGKTTNAQWATMLQTSCVPWLELRSKNIIFTVPTQYCKDRNIANPAELLQEWEDVINLDFYAWQGLSENPVDTVDRAPLLPWRVVQDIKPVVGYGHGGYPVVVQNDLYWFNEFTNVNNIKGIGSGAARSCWGTLYALGLNNQQSRYWSWSSLSEVTCNLFAFKVAKRQFSKGNTAAWPPSHPTLSLSFAGALAFAKDTLLTKRFDQASDRRIDNPIARLLPFIQIMEKVPKGRDYNGYGVITELYKAARRTRGIMANDQLKRDFFYETLCNYTKYDWRLFFRQWGIPISSVSRNKIYEKGYEYMEQKIWEYDPISGTGGDDIQPYNPYDRRNWEIIAVSSEERLNETLPNGPAIAIIDGNKSSHWSTKYSGSVVEPPHIIAIDLGAAVAFKGFKFVQSTNRANIKNIYIEAGNDHVLDDYEPIFGGFPYELPETKNNTEIERLTDKVLKAKFIRISILSDTDMYGIKPASLSGALAEFDLIKP